MSYLLKRVFNSPFTDMGFNVSFIYMDTVKSGYPALHKNLDNMNSLALSAIDLFSKMFGFHTLFMCRKLFEWIIFYVLFSTLLLAARGGKKHSIMERV